MNFLLIEPYSDIKHFNYKTKQHFYQIQFANVLSLFFHIIKKLIKIIFIMP